MPYIVAASFAGEFASACLCYRLATAPNPPGTDDGSPAVVFVIKLLMVGFVVFSTVVGALLGWLLGYLVGVLLPLPCETRNG